MLLKDICTTEVICCAADTRATSAAHLMRAHHVGDLVVVGNPVEERIPLGVVTDRDLVVEILGNGLDPSTTMVGSILRHPAILAQDSEDSSAVIERMRTHGVRRVPVVDRQGAVVGIVSLDDLLRILVDDAAALVQLMAAGENRERRLRR